MIDKKTMQEIKQKLAEQLQIDGLSEEQKGKIVEQLSEIILERLVYAVQGYITEEQLKSLEELAEKGESEQMAQLINEYIPDFPALAKQIVDETLEEFKKNYQIEKNNATDSVAGASSVAENSPEQSPAPSAQEESLDDLGGLEDLEADDMFTEEDEKILDEIEKAIEEELKKADNSQDNLSDTDQNQAQDTNQTPLMQQNTQEDQQDPIEKVFSAGQSPIVDELEQEENYIVDENGELKKVENNL